MDRNMSKEEFLVELNKEGLLIYGTTWLENFKRIQELKKYKKIVEEIDERLMPGKVSTVEIPDGKTMGDLSILEFVQLIIKDIKKKYFPPKETTTIKVDKAMEDIMNEINESIKKHIYGG